MLLYFYFILLHSIYFSLLLVYSGPIVAWSIIEKDEINDYFYYWLICGFQLIVQFIKCQKTVKKMSITASPQSPVTSSNVLFCQNQTTKPNKQILLFVKLEPENILLKKKLFSLSIKLPIIFLINCFGL